MLLSFDRLLLAGNVTAVRAITEFAQTILILETALGILIVGLFVAVVLKAIGKR
jgi:hypothetical protein